ncbi:MAG: hypothetical protein ACYCO0_03325 [Candidatus Micrarchaeaceae archaeon]
MVCGVGYFVGGDVMLDFDKNQMDNLKKVSEAKDQGEVAALLDEADAELQASMKMIAAVVIEGKALPETDAYKLYLPVFTEVYKKVYQNTLSNALDAVLSAMQPGDLTMNLNPYEWTKNMAGHIDSGQNKKLTSSVYLPNDDMIKILKALEDYEHVSNKTHVEKDPKMMRYNALNLYRDGFEVYMKILKDIYAKLNKVDPAGVGNSALRSYFDTNYPLLLASADNHLRNDVSHLNYDERDKYTTGELMHYANDMIARTFTAMTAWNNIIIGNFSNNLNIFKGKT